jgi:hypothetical protein
MPEKPSPLVEALTRALIPPLRVRAKRKKSMSRPAEDYGDRHYGDSAFN